MNLASRGHRVTRHLVVQTGLRPAARILWGKSASLLGQQAASFHRHQKPPWRSYNLGLFLPNTSITANSRSCAILSTAWTNTILKFVTLQISC